MRSIFLGTALIFYCCILGAAQDKMPEGPSKTAVIGQAEPQIEAIKPSPLPDARSVTTIEKEKVDTDDSLEKPATSIISVDDPAKDTKDKEKAADSGLTPSGYTRPDAKKRFKNYANSVVGPFALARYTVTSGLLTWRNSPYEWGDKWEGFGRRFANSIGKSAIRNTTIYALDEAMKVDSNFYRSQNRSVSARLRNSLFSTVTARNKDGKRVFGLPRIAGGFASEIISSTTWYPERYDYVHGIKGGVISLGVNAAFNVFREFIWK